MARLIDADKYPCQTCNVSYCYQNCEKFIAWFNETVDAVEVVRCKDCRWSRKKDHREPTDTPRELICQCFMHHHIPAPWGARMAVSEDDFCSYGERKDNGI